MWQNNACHCEPVRRLVWQSPKTKNHHTSPLGWCGVLSKKAFPRGEGGTAIAVTDEERRNRKMSRQKDPSSGSRISASPIPLYVGAIIDRP